MSLTYRGNQPVERVAASVKAGQGFQNGMEPKIGPGSEGTNSGKAGGEGRHSPKTV